MPCAFIYFIFLIINFPPILTHQFFGLILLAEVSEDKAAIQKQLDNRLASLTTQQATPQAVARKETGRGAASRASYGLISILLVGLLAFIIGQLSQSAMPELVEKAQELFNTLLAKFKTK